MGREAWGQWGTGKNVEDAPRKRAVPFIGFVSGPQDAQLLSGETIKGDTVDLTGRVFSNGQAHRALPGTLSLCMAVAARINGTVVNQVARLNPNPDSGIRISGPSGVLVMAATVKQVNGVWYAEEGGFYRTQRRLFAGCVLVRASRVPAVYATQKPLSAVVSV